MTHHLTGEEIRLTNKRAEVNTALLNLPMSDKARMRLTVRLARQKAGRKGK